MEDLNTEESSTEPIPPHPSNLPPSISGCIVVVVMTWKT
jgi:hypothetical protein